MAAVAACVLTSSASAAGGPYYAWGAGGLLGDGIEAGNQVIPEAINLTPGVTPTVVAGGWEHSLAIGSDGRLYALGGEGLDGGAGEAPSLQTRVVTLGLGVSPIAISAGKEHSLALGSDGKLYAWGANTNGEVGDGTNITRPTPEVIELAPGVTPTAISAGYGSSLAIGSDGHVYGWGVNMFGGGTEARSPQEIKVSGVPFDATTISAGGIDLAIGTDGQLYSWGFGLLGLALGTGEDESQPSPAPVTLGAGVTPTAISDGTNQALVIGSDHRLYSWGFNGLVGDGTNERRLSPEAITLASGVSPTIISADGPSLAIGSDGRAYSWGENVDDALGQGNFPPESLRPEPISFPAGVTPASISAGRLMGFATVTGGPPAGGKLTLKLTGLFGHFADKVSGSGWAVHGDTSVTLYQCVTTYYTPSSCDANNHVTVPLGTGTEVGKFKKAPLKVDVGPIGSHEDPCGLVGSYPCYVVAVGNTGDSTASSALGFTLPYATVYLPTEVPSGYKDAVKAKKFPIGDPLTAQECDSSVDPTSTLATNCDPATAIHGVATKSGSGKFSPSGVVIKVGAGYDESGSGSCAPRGTCSIVISDDGNPGAYAVVPITLAP